MRRAIWTTFLIGLWLAPWAVLASRPEEFFVAPKEEGRVVLRDSVGAAEWIEGSLGNLGIEDSVEAFGREFARIFLGGDGNEDFELFRRHEDNHGKVHHRLRQRLHGLPVEGAELLLHSESATGRVYVVNGRIAVGTAAVEKKGRETAMEADQAMEVAMVDAEISGAVLLDQPKLVYLLSNPELKPALAWSATVRYQSQAGFEIDRLYADAFTGTLLFRSPLVYRLRDRETYTANHDPNIGNLPGTLLLTEQQIFSGNHAADIVHGHAARVYDYFKDRFGRLSYDDDDSTVISTVNLGVNQANAFWIDNCDNGLPPGTCQMVFGDGDPLGAPFSPPTPTGPFGHGLDVVGHEFTHGVTADKSGLVNSLEAGALGESLSDIFGAAIESWPGRLPAGQSYPADVWSIGEDVVLGPGAIRYLKNPKQGLGYVFSCDPLTTVLQADFYPERYLGCGDNGGVHINSGIGNLAFYLLVEGGTHPRGVTTNTVPAIGMFEAEGVFFQAYNYLSSTSGFASMREATAWAAMDLPGAAAPRVAAVHEAWCAVGVPGAECYNPPRGMDDLLSINVGAADAGFLHSALLANDTDPDPGDSLYLLPGSFSTPTHGSLVEGSLSSKYVPGAFFWDSCQDHFTYTVSDRPTSPPGLIDTATVTVNCSSPELPLFLDAFESGSTLPWSAASVQGSGALKVTTEAAINGKYGLQAKVDGGGKAYVEDASPQGEDRYRVRFFLDPNSLTMAEGDSLSVFSTRSAGSGANLAISLRRSGGNYQVSARSLLDTGGWVATSWQTSVGPTMVELDLFAASAAGSADGHLRLWVDDVLVDEIFGIDNDQLQIDFARLGVTGGVDPGSSGSVLLDSFESRRLTKIGGSPDSLILE